MLWNARTMPSRAMRWAAIRCTWRPANVTEPLSARPKPVIALNSVVLPAPFGPMSEATEPGAP